MTVLVEPLPGAMNALLAEVMRSGCITRADQYGLLAILLQEVISKEEQQVINRLLYFTRHGKLHLSNQLSAIGDQPKA